MVKRTTQQPPSDQQQPYDNLLKSLFEGQEKQMLPYFLPGAEYLATLNVEVIRPPLRVDRVYRVKYDGHKAIAHIEFESGPNNEMKERLAEYHTYLYRKYKLPVLSVIVYPFPTKMAVSPLEETLGKRQVLVFHFEVYPLWQSHAEQYINEHAVVMYALLPTMAGANASLLHKAIDEMVKYYQDDTAKLAAELRWMGIVLRRVKTLPRTDKREIQERLNMWDDLMERDPKMKKIRKESEARGKTQGLAEGKTQGLAEGKTQGLAEGKTQGLAEGKTQGLAEGLQKAVIIAVKLRFPPLTELAQQKVSRVRQPETLNLLLEQVTSVPDEDAIRLLLDLIAA